VVPQPVPVPAPPAPAASPAPAPTTGIPAGQTPAAQQAAPVQAAKAPAAAVAAPAANAQTGAPAATNGQRSSISLTVGVPASVGLNSEFAVQVNATGVQDLYNAVFAVSYDPGKLEALSQTEGALLKQNDTPITFQAFADKKKGLVWVSESRMNSKDGANGSGPLASITFKAIGTGGAPVGLTNTTFTTRTGDKIPVTAFKSVVEVK
jgi:general secretion pathway protein D